ncbi:MAG: biotin/lipoyl-containing protein [Geminicoccaceae bacterium]
MRRTGRLPSPGSPRRSTTSSSRGRATTSRSSTPSSATPASPKARSPPASSPRNTARSSRRLPSTRRPNCGWWRWPPPCAPASSPARSRSAAASPGVNLAPPTSFVAYVSRTARTVEAVERDGAFAVSIDGGPAHELVLHWRPGLPLARASIDGEMIAAGCRRLPEGLRPDASGIRGPDPVRRRRAHELALLMPEKIPADTSKMLLSPMPGMIVMVDVVEGDLVKAGQTLCVLEAMKMENILKAERDGIIATVAIAERDTVSADQVLMTFE